MSDKPTKALDEPIDGSQLWREREQLRVENERLRKSVAVLAAYIQEIAPNDGDNIPAHVWAESRRWIWA